MTHLNEGSMSINHIIPEEVLLKIFSYLSTKDICSIAVCKHWRKLAQDASLWRCLELDFYEISSASMAKLVEKWTGNVTTLILRRFEYKKLL